MCKIQCRSPEERMGQCQEEKEDILDSGCKFPQICSASFSLSAMVNFKCPLDWATRCWDIWFNVSSGFPQEFSLWIIGLKKADCPPHVDGYHLICWLWIFSLLVCLGHNIYLLLPWALLFSTPSDWDWDLYHQLSGSQPLAFQGLQFADGS